MRDLTEEYNSRSTPTILVDDNIIIVFNEKDMKRRALALK